MYTYLNEYHIYIQQNNTKNNVTMKKILTNAF